ncbi:DUF957 domain-containing protein [Salmonella enterica subsp. enterica]|nr:DUF957 domain-containing protein [Salmonella enterica subsp. enterica serovar Mikawasima]EDN7229246.1 DUF957 domain-containing protein [Salmonella enterica subsp. enterica serovar Mikawasima]
MKVLTTREGLEILALWLQDNVDMENELIFDNDVDQTTSVQLLPCVESALSLLPEVVLPEDDTDAAGIAELATIAMSADFVAGEEPDNNARAALAAELLCLFASRTGMARSGECAQTMLVDLLADLMHLADRLGIDSFSQMVCVAGMHHDDESRETDCYGDTVSG